MARNIVLVAGLLMFICVQSGSSEVVPDGVVYTEVKKTLVQGVHGILTCRFYRDPQAIYWKKGSNPDDASLLLLWHEGEVSGQRYDDGSCDIDENYSLIIKNVSLVDAGRYYCLVSNYLGILINNYTDVSVVGNAIETKSQVTLQMRPYLRGVLQCSIRIRPRMVSWIKKSTTSSLDDVLAIFEDSGTVVERSGVGYDEGLYNISEDYSLVINEVQVRNEGIYTCNVTDFDTGISFQDDTRVNVVAQPREPFPTILECLHDQSDLSYCSLDAETASTITCLVSEYYPDINLNFLYGSKKVEILGTKERDNTDGTKNKTITIAFHGSNELYTCVAFNIPGTPNNRSTSALLHDKEHFIVLMAFLIPFLALMFFATLAYVIWRKSHSACNNVQQENNELTEIHSKNPTPPPTPEDIKAFKKLVNNVLIRHYQNICNLTEGEERRKETEKAGQTEKAEETKKAEEKKEAEETKKAGEIREAEETKKAEEKKEAEETKKAEEKKEAEETKNAEEKKEAEETKNAEEKKEAEETKKAEEKKEAEETENAEEKKEAEETKKAKEKKEAEETKKAEEKKEAEETKKAEKKREAGETRQAEEAKKAGETEQAKEAKNAIDEIKKSLLDANQMCTDREIMKSIQLNKAIETKDTARHRTVVDFAWPSDEELKLILHHLTPNSMTDICKKLEIKCTKGDVGDEEKWFDGLREWRNKVAKKSIDEKHKLLLSALESNKLRGLLPPVKGRYIYNAELVDMAFQLLMHDLLPVTESLCINATKLVKYRPVFQHYHLKIGTIKLLSQLLDSIAPYNIELLEKGRRRLIFCNRIGKLHYRKVATCGVVVYDMSYGELSFIFEAMMKKTSGSDCQVILAGKKERASCGEGSSEDATSAQKSDEADETDIEIDEKRWLLEPKKKNELPKYLVDLQRVLQLTDQDIVDGPGPSCPITAHVLFKIWKEKPRQSVFNYRAALAYGLEGINLSDLANDVIAGKCIHEETSLAFIQNMVEGLTPDQLERLGNLLHLSEDRQHSHTSTPIDEISKQICKWVADWTKEMENSLYLVKVLTGVWDTFAEVTPLETTLKKHKDLNDKLVEHGFLDLAREIMIIEQQLGYVEPNIIRKIADMQPKDVISQIGNLIHKYKSRLLAQ